MVDDVVAHLDGAVASADSFTKSRYAGFYAVSVATVIELSVKQIVVEFANSKSPVFGGYINRKFDRLNARVSYKDLKGMLEEFGGSYSSSFDQLVKGADESSMRARNGSIVASYGNLITCRHKFAHEGEVPNNSTYEEVKKGFAAGKVILECLHGTLV
ncbi:HEPN domain-containing protein [Stenotrophomonas sp. PSU-St19]